MARKSINNRFFKFLSNLKNIHYKIFNTYDNNIIDNFGDLYNTFKCDIKTESIFFNYCLYPYCCVNLFKFKYKSSNDITYKHFKFDLNLYLKYFNNFYKIYEKKFDYDPFSDYFSFIISDYYVLKSIETNSFKIYNKLVENYSEEFCEILRIHDYLGSAHDSEIELKVFDINSYNKFLNKFKKQNNLLNQSDDYIIKYIENKMKINDICNV